MKNFLIIFATTAVLLPGFFSGASMKPARTLEQAVFFDKFENTYKVEQRKGVTAAPKQDFFNLFEKIQKK